MTINEQLARLLAENHALRQESRPPVDPLPPPPHTPFVDNDRLAKLEGAYDALKVVRPMTIAVVGLFLAALVFVLGFLTNQIHDLTGKVDAIPARLSDEFRAMRAETAAQNSAIANAITATRQAQPQILLVPAPAPAPAPVPAPQPSAK